MSSVPTVRLRPRKALPFFCRHPWVFAGAIASVQGSPQVGDEVRVESADGQFIARGLFNPDSKIQVRLYSWQDASLDEQFWADLIDRAVALRRDLFGESQQARACRLLFSEGDGLSGLTVDRYGDWLLTQWTSAALATRQELLLGILQDRLRPRGIWRRTEKGIGDLEGLETSDGLALGEPPPAALEICENELLYSVDVVEGQKTGFYFDQRGNRRAVAKYLADTQVLDVCTYTGGFAMNAIRHGGAASVLAVDSSRSAIELAKRNAQRNELTDRISFEVSDMFDLLERVVAERQQFDAIILDPPKLARTRGGLQRALKGYVRLNRLAMQALRPGGILATCSCSGLVSLTEFEHTLVQAAQQAERSVQVLEAGGQAPDHPVSIHCLETHYLKCLICRVQPAR
ncbi:MAG: class I SAM-dependent rRNA methyltransferase [Planctomycetaceae bacterium]|nr:class I SAM-dependent rRNA methyltransferase [Planctomycetaceae bacterium]